MDVQVAENQRHRPGCTIRQSECIRSRDVCRAEAHFISENILTETHRSKLQSVAVKTNSSSFGQVRCSLICSSISGFHFLSRSKAEYPNWAVGREHGALELCGTRYQICTADCICLWCLADEAASIVAWIQDKGMHNTRQNKEVDLNKTHHSSLCQLFIGAPDDAIMLFNLIVDFLSLPSH
jgi:hypothetical protein